MPIGINGTGSITGISAGGLPDATITQAELASGVSTTGPTFYAYNSSTTSIVNGAQGTQVQLQTEVFDTASCFDTSTGRFTPNVAGYYQINGAVSFMDSPLTASSAQAFIAKNGTDLNSLAFRAGVGSSGGYIGISICGIVYMNGTTDYLVLCGYQNQGSARNTNTGAGNTFMSGTLIRGA